MGTLLRLSNSCIYRISPTICYRGSTRRRLYPRFFHTSGHSQMSLVDTCLSQTHSALVILHSSTGLPWALTFPLTALLIRGILIGPLSVYSWQITRKHLAMRPLTIAWAQVYNTQRAKDQKSLLKPDNSRRAAMKKLRVKQAELRRKFGTPIWASFLPFLQFPVWLLVTEAIRRMAGARHGLFGLFSNYFAESEDVVEMDRESILRTVDSLAVPVEPSFAWEGILWFPDLLVPDPQLILPFFFSGVMLGNIFYLQHSNRLRGIVQGKWSRRLTNIFKVIALAAGPLMLQMPSAVFVYWISSALIGLGQHVLIEKYMPFTGPSITPCKPRKPIGALDWSPVDEKPKK